MKTSINNSWKSWVDRQLKNKVNITKIEEILRRENYSSEIINNLLYSNKPPKYYTIDNFLTDIECEEIIEIAKPLLKKALVSGTKDGFISKGRSGSNCWLPHDTSEVTLAIAKKISDLVKIPLSHAESFQVIHYGKDQLYAGHYDGWKRDGTEKTRRLMKYGGQRILTALIYLNNVEEGGSTKFIKLNKEIEPKKGRILVFSNVVDGTNILHPDSLHTGCPIIKGEKWAFNLWFRETPYHKLFLH